MTILASFRGEDVALGVLATDEGGTGDTSFFVNQGGTPTVINTQAQPLRLQVSQAAATTAYIAWGPSKLGVTVTNCSFRMYAKFTAWASAAFTLLSTATGASSNWKINIAGTSGIAGEIRIIDGTNTQHASTGGDGNTIPLNTLVRIEVAVAASGIVTIWVFNGESTTPLFMKSISGLPAATFTSFRIGSIGTTPTVPTYYMGTMALNNTTTPIGPYIPPSTADCSVWDGTDEQPATMTVWNGTSEVPISEIEFV